MPISDPEKASEYQRLWRVSHPGYYRDRYRKKKAAGLLSRAKQLESERKYTQRIHRDPVLRMITAARKRARALNIEFNILAHQIEMPVFCPYLGYLLNVSADGCAHPSSPSLDRIRPEKGYTIDNVEVISHRANQIKNNATPAELRAIADRLEKLLA